MRKSMRVGLALLLLIGLLGALQTAWGQEVTAAIVGSVDRSERRADKRRCGRRDATPTMAFSTRADERLWRLQPAAPSYRNLRGEG